MLVHVERMNAKLGNRQGEESIGWTLGGTAFVIRDKQSFTSTWLPRFFAQAKFSSFTRKLYRWGFRKINPSVVGSDSASIIVFGNEYFQRDNTTLLPHMRSITAAKMRSEQPTESSAPAIFTNASSNAPSMDQLMTQDSAMAVETFVGIPGLSQLQNMPSGEQHSSLLHDEGSLSSFAQREQISQSSTETQFQPQGVSAVGQYLQALSGATSITNRNPIQALVALELQNSSAQAAEEARLQQERSQRERLAAIAEVFLRSRQQPPPR